MPLVRGTRRYPVLADVAAFSPSDIAGLQLWLKADADLYQDAAKTTSAVADGDVVGAWADQSGNGNDATQATTSKKPLLNIRGDGTWEVEHDQIDDYLAISLTVTAEGTWLFGNQHGIQLSRMPIGKNPQIQRLSNLMSSLAYNVVVSGSDRSNLITWTQSYGLGAEQCMVATTSDTTIYHSVTSPNGPYTITFIGANGVTYQTTANDTTDVAAQGLTAPVTMLVPVAVRTDTALTKFYCYGNQLTGSIPDLNANTALTEFHCGINQLTGSIPDLNANTALTLFRCYSNQLTGSIPDLNANTALTVFHCGINQLTGSIPDLNANTALTEFYCYSNQLTGSIPDLNANTALTLFRCGSNQLTGYVGTSMPASLTNFRAQTNALSETAVNNILIHLDNAGATNGTCKLEDGTNAVPTGVGITAKNNLIGKGWTVTTN